MRLAEAEVEIATEVWVSALIRRASLAGASAVVARRGDERAGAVLVRTWNSGAREARLYRQAPHAPDAEPVWSEPLPGAAEPELDAYVERQLGYDSDLWVVEVEDREGRTFLTETVERR